MLANCPICESADLVQTVRRHRLPVLQNRVYETRAAALAAPCAPFQLATCKTCGFSFNAAFQANLIAYDPNYDNEVPSPLFTRHMEMIATMLIERLNLTSGTVYDVGCGKGTFLRLLCRLAPGIQGVGVDPSCTSTHENNFTLIRDEFRSDHIRADAKLVLLRHVLEHIPTPVSFLRMIRKAIPDIPLYVEVPSFEWILRKEAFWDFCYEHCNYFTGKSLKHALARAGFMTLSSQTCFGDQYQWTLASPGNMTDTLSANGSTEVEAVLAYSETEDAHLHAAKERIATANAPLVWGMATKGVIFSTLMNSNRLSGGIDLNPNKQKRFVPGSGIEIHPPEWIRDTIVNPTIFIMNANYAEEIRQLLFKMGVDAESIVMG
ncbi:MAG: SAM-dependent methyltransferase [Pseudolabrys sp.]|jgi:hypothetical protein|nr:SAM-dependent methyltransferase [Pseudolabrys sp.]